MKAALLSGWQTEEEEKESAIHPVIHKLDMEYANNEMKWSTGS